MRAHERQGELVHDGRRAADAAVLVLLEAHAEGLVVQRHEDEPPSGGAQRPRARAEAPHVPVEARAVDHGDVDERRGLRLPRAEVRQGRVRVLGF